MSAFKDFFLAQEEQPVVTAEMTKTDDVQSFGKITPNNSDATDDDTNSKTEASKEKESSKETIT